MGHRKRKRGTRKLDGGRNRASSDKPKPSDGDLEREDREDSDQMGIISADSDEGRADSDQLMKEEREDREDSDQMGIISADSGEGRADSDKLMKEAGVIHDGDLLDEEGKGRTAYLVACHWDWSTCPTPYSVYKMDLAPSDASSSAKAKLLNPAGSLDTPAGGKSFISLRSGNRSWIVGVGGDSDVIIVDTKSPDPAQAVIHGPKLMSAKWCPVLTAVGDKIYALCKKPSWTSDPDFPPWFEVLDVSQASVVSDGHVPRLKGCSWSNLPIPPCIPWKLKPRSYTNLPITILMSYVLVAPYILVSYNQPWGTYAFDTNSDKWQKVHDNPLPFLGCASRHGPIFLASSKKDGAIHAYCIHVTTSAEGHDLELSITTLPVEYEEDKVEAGPCCFSSLDNEHFCVLSFELSSRGVMLHSGSNEPYPTKGYLSLRTYQIKHPLLETPEEMQLDMKSVVAISSKLEHRFKIRDVRHGITPLASTLLSIRVSEVLDQEAPEEAQ